MASSSSADSNINPPNSDDENSKVSVDVSDIKTMLSVINVISRRGGFLPSDFNVVGDLFNKFTKLTTPP